MRLNGFFCGARAVLGTTYLLFPRLPLQGAGPGPGRHGACTTARILGARHLAQALVTSGYPPPAVPVLGAEADAAHAASMAVLGLLSRRWRRAALTDALVAATLTAIGIAAARTDPGEPTASGWRAVRNRYANLLPPGSLAVQAVMGSGSSTGGG